MAVSGARRLGKQAVWLVGGRFALFVVAALPGMLVALQELASGPGRQPFYSAAATPLPFAHLVRLADELPSAGLALLGVGTLIAWLGVQLLTAGAVTMLDPRGDPRGDTPSPRRAIFDLGWRRLPAYLRVALAAAATLALGLVLVGRIFKAVAEHGAVAGWSAEALLLDLTFWRLVTLLSWAFGVGVVAFWCRVLIAGGGRRYVRRLPGMVLRLMWRRPLGALLLHTSLATLAIVLQLAVLLAWARWPEPATLWLGLWLTVLLASAWLWYWRLGAAIALWRGGGLDDLDRRPDEPWGLGRRLMQRLARRWRKRRPDAVSAAPGGNELRHPATAPVARSGRRG